MKRERDDLRQDTKKQKLEINTLEELAKTLELERDESRKKDKLHLTIVTDTIQCAVEERVGAFLQDMAKCFPAGTFIFDPSKAKCASEVTERKSPTKAPPNESAATATSSEAVEIAEHVDDDSDSYASDKN